MGKATFIQKFLGLPIIKCSTVACLEVVSQYILYMDTPYISSHPSIHITVGQALVKQSRISTSLKHLVFSIFKDTFYVYVTHLYTYHCGSMLGQRE